MKDIADGSLYFRTTEKTRNTRNKRNARMVAGIFIISFSLIYSLERFYDHHRMLDQIDTMFDADTTYYLDGFSNGWGGPSFRHPFAGMMFSLPVRAASKLAHKITGADDMRTRRELALFVVPLFQGVKNVILYLLLVGIGITTWQALVLCSLNLFALSTITVGSVPETFAINSMILVLLAWLMTHDFKAPSKLPIWCWIAAGGFAIGVTITNVVPLAIFHFLGRRFGQAKSWWNSLGKSVIVSILSLILAFILGAMISVAYSYSPIYLLPFGDRGDLGFWLQKHRPSEELMIAAASTFAGVIQPEAAPNEHLIRKRFNENNKPSLMIMFTYAKARLNNWISVSWTLLFAGLLLIGAWNSYRRGPVWSSLTIASASLLIFNFTLHMFFYLYDMFLYALHWQVPMIFSLAGLTLIKPGKALGSLVLVALTIASVASGFQFIAKVIATLAK